MSSAEEEKEPAWERPGFVSLWVGRFSGDEELGQYTEFTYDEDGESVLPAFCGDFGLGWFDEDFIEAYLVEEETSSLAELLEGCSYDEQIIPAFEALGLPEGTVWNTVVLLYDFAYPLNNRGKSAASGANRLVFAGTAEYE
ncbi:immunity 22 family protein [Paenibacillus sp. UNC499MF]|uniref:immunity 22 family protein n=1 Tax=Paenibacillus sp. UNC499MF TaxID=1502751 RepID=UPI0008A04670|nr:immunity 22 family protein [Paenibacillus sp. UNC499MF]SEF67676.1 Immunity protein 22 [Paenibacillus sp. UNC499MF]